MGSQNSAWNLFCARCHTTHLTVLNKNAAHTIAETEWVDPGIACEACHGPGSLHARYFESNYVNRLAAFLNSELRGESVAYVANARKLEKGPAMSVCARSATIATCPKLWSSWLRVCLRPRVLMI